MNAKVEWTSYLSACKNKNSILYKILIMEKGDHTYGKTNESI